MTWKIARQWLMFPVLGCAWQVANALIPAASPVFRSYGMDQGLPSSQIQALAQDKSGLLWIGTSSGLASFDGQRFRSYVAQRDRQNALASGGIEALLVDSNGRLWIASEGGHLARFRPETDDFERLSPNLGDMAQIEIWSLAQARERVWIGTYGAGLVELSMDGRLVAQFGLSAGLSKLDVIDVLPDHAGGLWIADLDSGLSRFDIKGSRAIAMPAQADPSALTPLGLAIRDHALHFSTREGMRCRVQAAQAPVCEQIPALNLPGRARMLLSSVHGDFSGGNGELLWEHAGRQAHLTFRPGSLGGVPNHNFWVGMADREEGLWMGTTGGGLLHLPREAFQFQVWQPDPLATSGLLDGRVRSVANVGSRVYIATLESGLFALDPESGEIKGVATPELKAQRLWALLVDADDRLWIGHQGGLARYRMDAQGTLIADAQWSQSELVGPRVDLLHRDAGGRIWAASMAYGITRIDATGQRVLYPFNTNGLVGSEIQQLLTGADGAVWVASDLGLMRYREACECFDSLIQGARVEAVALASAGRVYAFVDGQLVSYQWREALFRNAEIAPRRFDEFQTVGGMRMAGDSLWMASAQGLFRYTPATDALSAFDARDGLVTREFSDRPFHTDAAGRFWLGSEAGVVSFDPASFEKLPAASKLRFADLGIEDASGHRDLDPSVPAEFAFDERDLSVSVRLETLARAHAQRFSFHLVGSDSDRADPGAASERRFGALRPGHYRLQVRAWDGYGQAAANALEWRFRIDPPFWRSAWAFLIYALSTALILAWLNALRRRRVRAQSVLAQARRQTEWAERLAAEKSQLVAELSHEIRNPLNGLLGMSRLLGSTELDTQQQRYVRLLSDAGKQLTTLLDDILDWSRIEAGHAPLEMQSVAVKQLLEPSFQRYAQLAAAKPLAFHVHFVGEPVVAAVPARLIQILENLLANAIKFTRVGAVDCCIRPDPLDMNWISFEICDTGPGLSDEQRARLFKPFERGEGEALAPGTGLGLTISRALAERMGGSLVAEASERGGARLVLRLRPSTGVPMSATVAVPTANSRESLKGLQVLVVEDDAIGREVLESQLRAWGASVTAEDNAMDALISLNQRPVDAVLLDWDLPGLSGLELGRTLRAQYPRASLCLIAVTGRATPADRALGEQAGFDAHLTKPLDPQALWQVLSALSTQGAR